MHKAAYIIKFKKIYYNILLQSFSTKHDVIKATFVPLKLKP